MQFRVDFLNLFNHLTFRGFPNNAGGTDVFGSAPSTTTLSAADYNTWATANGQPASTMAAGTALLNQINATINGFRNGGVATGGLPANFFTVPLPANFYGTQPAGFDIRTVDGFKLFRLRQSYNTSGLDIYQNGQSRYIQFGVKIFF